MKGFLLTVFFTSSCLVSLSLEANLSSHEWDGFESKLNNQLNYLIDSEALTVAEVDDLRDSVNDLIDQNKISQKDVMLLANASIATKVAKEVAKGVAVNVAIEKIKEVTPKVVEKIDRFGKERSHEARERMKENMEAHEKSKDK